MNGNFPVPRLVAWEVTRKCNLKCRHCRADSCDDEYRDELTFQDAKKLIDDIASFAKPVLILTGGEPLLRQDIWDIVSYARERGLTPALGTNATLIDDDTAKRIYESSIRKISVSLDFPTKEEHDSFRGIEGAYEAAIRGITAARKAGLDVQINTCVTKKNFMRLKELHRLAEQLDVQAFHPFFLVPTGRGIGISGDALDADECEEALKITAEISKTSSIEVKPTDAPHYRRVFAMSAAAVCAKGKGCLAGTGFCFISSTGDVKPCGYFDKILGNIKEIPFSKIWQESEVLNDLRNPQRLKGKCAICEFKNVCGGCRARALAVSGDYLAEEPSCKYIPHAEFLYRIQESFPLSSRPYAELGKDFALSEEGAFDLVCAMKQSAIVRRIGASIDSRKIGFYSTLVALKAEKENLDFIVSKINESRYVTHNYLRDGDLNIWFTVIAPSKCDADAFVEKISSLEGVSKIFDFPSVRGYKLRTVFGDAGKSDGKKNASSIPCHVSIDEEDKKLIAKICDDITSLGLEPFTESEISRIKSLYSSGVIRRFGAFMNPVSAGLKSNALTAWAISEEKVDEVGRVFASKDFVSHCILRKTYSDWPYSIYAMIHAKSECELEKNISELSQEAKAIAYGIENHLIFKTLFEYKKSSFEFDINGSESNYDDKQNRYATN
jgi:radical SAM protein with 4Fe4S-binding SPASM domain